MVARAGGFSAGSTGGGSCSQLPRCTREIGQQEAAVGNVGAGNSRCCLPNTTWACMMPSPAVSPHSGYPGMFRVSRPFLCREQRCPGFARKKQV